MEINVQTSKIPAVLRKLIQNRLAADPDVFITHLRPFCNGHIYLIIHRFFSSAKAFLKKQEIKTNGFLLKGLRKNPFVFIFLNYSTAEINLAQRRKWIT